MDKQPPEEVKSPEEWRQDYIEKNNKIIATPFGLFDPSDMKKYAEYYYIQRLKNINEKEIAPLIAKELNKFSDPFKNKEIRKSIINISKEITEIFKKEGLNMGRSEDSEIKVGDKIKIHALVTEVQGFINKHDSQMVITPYGNFNIDLAEKVEEGSGESND